MNNTHPFLKTILKNTVCYLNLYILKLMNFWIQIRDHLIIQIFVPVLELFHLEFQLIFQYHLQKQHHIQLYDISVFV